MRRWFYLTVISKGTGPKEAGDKFSLGQFWFMWLTWLMSLMLRPGFALIIVWQTISDPRALIGDYPQTAIFHFISFSKDFYFFFISNGFFLFSPFWCFTRVEITNTTGARVVRATFILFWGWFFFLSLGIIIIRRKARMVKGVINFVSSYELLSHKLTVTL